MQIFGKEYDTNLQFALPEVESVVKELQELGYGADPRDYGYIKLYDVKTGETHVGLIEIDRVEEKARFKLSDTIFTSRLNGQEISKAINEVYGVLNQHPVRA
jgi:hypothetical protein